MESFLGLCTFFPHSTFHFLFLDGNVLAVLRFVSTPTSRRFPVNELWKPAFNSIWFYMTIKNTIMNRFSY